MGAGHSRRLPELDGLRGLAALSVFSLHLFLLGPPWRAYGWAAIGRDGIAAVDLFFVLSAFVLTRSLLQESQTYSTFVWRRVLRLYPAYLAALILSIALSLSRNRAGLELLSQYGATVQWAKPITVEQLFRHLFLITPGIHFERIDGPIWSLVVEMRISLLLPALVSVLHYGRAWRFALLAISFPICGLIPEPLLGIRFIPLFLLGICLAMDVESRERSARANMLLVAFGAMLYCNGIYLNEARVIHDYLAGLGSGLFIIAAISSPKIKQVLTLPPIKFMGDISYSFYLLHLPIILFTASWLYPLTGSATLCGVASLVVSILVAKLFWELVERPAIRFRRMVPSPA